MFLRLSGIRGALSAALLGLWLGAALAAPAVAGPASDAALSKYYELKIRRDPHARQAIEAAARQFPDNLTIQLEAGYAALAVKDNVAARRAFTAAVRIAPGRVRLWKQLGYIDINLKDTDAAIDAFEHASRLAPNDQTLLLQLAYLQDQKGARRSAAELFHKVMYGSDREKAKIGCEAYSNLRGLPEKVLPEPWFGEFTATPEYLNHDSLGVMSSTVRIGQHFGSDTYIDVYGLGRLNADTKSGMTSTGTQLFQDNYGELGFGIRAKPLADLPVVLYVESGAAYDLVDQNRNRWRGDFRAVAAYYDEWNMGLDCSSGGHFKLRPVADAYADAGYYSRYDNFLTSARVRPGLRMFETDTSAIDLYGIASVNWDSKGVASNRFFEVGMGVAFRLYEPTRLVLRLEGARKFATNAPDYTDLRALLEYSLDF